jgi:hypothetical protein
MPSIFSKPAAWETKMRVYVWPKKIMKRTINPPKAPLIAAAAKRLEHHRVKRALPKSLSGQAAQTKKHASLALLAYKTR